MKYQILIYILLAVTLFFPSQLDQKIPYILGLLSLLLLPVYIKECLKIAEDFNKFSLLKKLILLFFILFLLTAALSTIYSMGLKSFPQFIVYLSGFVIFISAGRIFPSIKSKQLLGVFLIATSVILSLISIYNTFFTHIVNKKVTGVSFMWVYYGHNHLSSILIFTIPLATYFLIKYWQSKTLRLLSIFTVSFLLFSLYISFARASMISLLVSLIFSLIIFRPLPKRKMVLIITVLLILFILPLTTREVLRNTRIPEIQKSQITWTSRMQYWQQAIKNFQQSPVLGLGLNTFRYIDPKSSFFTTFAHNFFLQMLSDTGIFGFLSSIGIILFVLAEGYRKIQAETKFKNKLLYLAFWVGLIASAINSLVDFDWQIPAVFFIFFIVSGFLFSSSRKPSLLDFNIVATRVFDIAVSSFVLFLLSPFWLIFYLLIKLSSEGPFIFRQKRLGKNKGIFTMYKFRTMVYNAEHLKKSYIHLNETQNPVFKIKDDPRFTKFGKFLSHSGLDELPQLINVLKGEMSLVGPRPLPVEEAMKVPKKYHKRFSVLPGITSSWVIKGNHKLTFDQWMKLDLAYITKNSVFYNLKILFFTMMLIFRKTFQELWLSASD